MVTVVKEYQRIEDILYYRRHTILYKTYYIIENILLGKSGAFAAQDSALKLLADIC